MSIVFWGQKLHVGVNVYTVFISLLIGPLDLQFTLVTLADGDDLARVKFFGRINSSLVNKQ